eukprot:gnl/Dysnectes_brevis/4402_a5895_654.p1 GENE.gnl/Dysnectes_brevis/4402_a5895_654~~gnl/Dysnectes_brevis/4402_a5895_654.p1  ORF type:complete len:416 (-),score=82.81 gnl/Dysnectes_brevis/4402_a5895_654:152-1399(-)
MLKDFKIEKFLGKGSYGSVFKAKRITDGKLYAIKEINIKYMNVREREDALNEIRILASVFHPNVIGYFEAFHENKKLYIITELAPRGDLQRDIKMRRMKRRNYSENSVWSILIQLLVGLRSLHVRNILHRDIKTANIFVFDGGMVKIGDLGVAKLLKDDKMARTAIGTPFYISPEIWQSQPYDEKSDTWSLGCLIYEMCTFRHPFEGRDLKDLAQHVMRGKYAPIPRNYSSEIREIVGSMLRVDKDRRPSIQQLLQQPAVMSRLHLCPTPVRADVLPSSPPRMVGTIRARRPKPRAQYSKLRSPIRRGRALFDPLLPSPAYAKRSRWAEVAKDHCIPENSGKTACFYKEPSAPRSRSVPQQPPRNRAGSGESQARKGPRPFLRAPKARAPSQRPVPRSRYQMAAAVYGRRPIYNL